MDQTGVLDHRNQVAQVNCAPQSRTGRLPQHWPRTRGNIGPMHPIGQRFLSKGDTATRCLLWALLITAGPLLTGIAAGQSRLAERIHFQPPPIAVLARQVQHADSGVQWDFVNITLEVLFEAYRRELDDAANERLRSQTRRAKLARWQSATRDLIARLEASRLRLLDGARFSILVDPQQQVLIVIDGQPIAVTAPRPESERQIGNRVIEQFCSYNDCHMLESGLAGQSAMPASGLWVFDQYAPPAFEIDGMIRCEFADLTERERKAEICRSTADEVAEFAEALRIARDRGYRIEWEQLAQTPPSTTGAGEVVVNSDGAFVQLSMHLLSLLDREDWQRLVEWLRLPGARQRPVLVLRSTRRLVSGGVRG
jgi:hypothetical protein